VRAPAPIPHAARREVTGTMRHPYTYVTRSPLTIPTASRCDRLRPPLALDASIHRRRLD
jgi:hypothetical protein